MREYHVLNLGAGVQSTTIYLMFHAGAIQPQIDYAIFADTQDEPEAVYAHLEWLKSLNGPPILVRSKGRLSEHLMRGTNSTGGRFASIPAYTGGDGLRVGKVRRQCSREYKVEVIERAIRREIVGLKPRQRVPKDVTVHQYFGISLDEAGRSVRIRENAKDNKWVATHFPLIEMFMTRAHCRAWLAAYGIPHEVPRSACVYCFAGEDQVITRQGERQIRDVVGRAELLVPQSETQCWGRWLATDVRSFGMQPVFDLTLRRGRSTRVFHPTAEHRWIVEGRDGYVSTSELRRGDRLATLYRPPLQCSGTPVMPSAIGIMHGFSFGDGGNSVRPHSPGRTPFYGEKDKAMLPYFNGCRIVGKGTDAPEAVDLPRYWKEPPPLDESRSYLLGWLAGYFAADGSISDGGQAVIYSAVRANMQAVRDACIHLGIDTSPIHTKSRVGFGKRSDLFSVCLPVQDLPDKFWLIPAHGRRAAAFKQNAKFRYQKNWTVHEVVNSGRLDEVFCAVIPDLERFTLAGNILTANCPFHSDTEWLRIKENERDWQLALDVDAALRIPGTVFNRNIDQQLFLHRSCKPLVQIQFDPNQSERDRQMGFNFAAECLGVCGV